MRPRDPRSLVPALATHIRRLLADQPDVDACDGIGVVVPGMVERSTQRVLHAPTLGWRDVALRERPAGAPSPSTRRAASSSTSSTPASTRSSRSCKDSRKASRRTSACSSAAA
jgi:hypothetical protein